MARHRQAGPHENQIFSGHKKSSIFSCFIFHPAGAPITDRRKIKILLTVLAISCIAYGYQAAVPGEGPGGLAAHKMKAGFDGLNLTEKAEAVDKGYFYTCTEVEGFCRENRNYSGCGRYCLGGGFYPENEAVH